MCVEDRQQVVKWQEAAERFRIERDEARAERDELRKQLLDTINAAQQQLGIVRQIAKSVRTEPVYADMQRSRSRSTGPCPCACNSGGFCGSCGHAGCGGRR